MTNLPTSARRLPPSVWRIWRRGMSRLSLDATRLNLLSAILSFAWIEIAPLLGGQSPTAACCAMMNAFTVDVEDYFHVSAFDNVIPRETWGDFESRVARNTHQLLDLL